MTEGYIYRELSKAEPPQPDGIVRMKMWAEDGGESRWVNLPLHVRDLVKAVASLTPEEARNLSDLVIAAAVMGHENLGFAKIRDMIITDETEGH